MLPIVGAAGNVVNNLLAIVLGNLELLDEVTDCDERRAMIGAVGVVLGSAVGALGSLAVPGFVSALERMLNIHFLNTDVYPVSFLPSDLLARDVLLVGGIAFVMCVVAAIYPALRAARLAPAMILNQDRS